MKKAMVAVMAVVGSFAAFGLTEYIASTLDLAGNTRLTDGKVAIGAYETTDRGLFPGLLMLFR